MLGSYLIPLLLSKGHTVVNLTTQKVRSGGTESGYTNLFWDPSRGEVDRSQLHGIDAVINLAGFNLANRWTEENKRQMVQSRLDSTKLLVDIALNPDQPAKVFVSASGSGFYPDSSELMDELGPKGEGFLSDLTDDWEKALLPLQKRDARIVIMRTAVILDKKHGALARMIPFFKLGMGAGVGNGKQFLSWIHAEDAAGAYVYAVENSGMQGIYNLTTDSPVTNNQFSAQLAKAMKKPFFLPNIPAFMLKILFGKMADLVLRNNRMSAKKILNAGFQFKFPNLQEALNNVFHSQI